MYSLSGSKRLQAKVGTVRTVMPDTFESERHFYPRVQNATVHPVVASLFNMSVDRIIKRYTHMHPSVNADDLRKWLQYKPKHFRWAGADCFNVTSSDGRRQVVVIETNSCPSGQKSMPLLRDVDEEGGYRRLMQTTFHDLLHYVDETGAEVDPEVAAAAAAAAAVAPSDGSAAVASAPSGGAAAATADGSAVPRMQIDNKAVPEGVLAVLFDKNAMESSGYAAVLADLASEPVYLAEYFLTDEAPPVRYTVNRVMALRIDAEVAAERGLPTFDRTEVFRLVPGAKLDGTDEPAPEDPTKAWVPVRAAFRYVTQRPWTRFPVHCKTKVLNPILPCLAGGRNKQAAAIAYQNMNLLLESSGSALRINTPRTIDNVRKEEVPMWIKAYGGSGVVKTPYGNAGVGVTCILNQHELDTFMSKSFHYEKFILQQLIGNASWGSVVPSVGAAAPDRFYHIGTVPDKRGNIFVADLRCMVCATSEGWRPVAMYARRAAKPLADHVEDSTDSWSMLGTNLSKEVGDGTALEFTTESERLLLMDTKDFNRLGLSIDDLLEAYVQTVLATIAIDQMCCQLMPEGKFNKELFKSVCDDPVLIGEVTV